MTDNQINTRDKYRDNLVSFISDKYVSVDPEAKEANNNWISSFVEEVGNFFYNSGYNDAMESSEVEYDISTTPLQLEDEEDNSSIFAPMLDDISDEELINELKARGYKGTLSISKDIELN